VPGGCGRIESSAIHAIDILTQQKISRFFKELRGISGRRQKSDGIDPKQSFKYCEEKRIWFPALVARPNPQHRPGALGKFFSRL
jgi:hypothetical protein